MIKSMTGFGRCEITNGEHKFTVELKSVNHRYLDMNIRMPKKLGYFESAVRGLLKEYMERGKVDVYIAYENFTGDSYSLKYNETLAKQYLGHLKDMSEKLGVTYDVSVTSLAQFPEIFTMEEQVFDEKELWQGLERALCGAAEQFVDSRTKEGEHLKADLLAKLNGMVSYVDFIEERSPIIVSEYRERLREHVQELLTEKQLDENRIAMEVTLFADKTCVDEETVRLKSHIKAMKEALCSENGIGRKLDFIAQEMNREANTLLSKTTDLEISNIGINLKTDIEKVREQIQNIE